MAIGSIIGFVILGSIVVLVIIGKIIRIRDERRYQQLEG